MRERPSLAVSPPTRPGMLLEVSEPDVAFYRFLLDVTEPGWIRRERAAMSDEAVRSLLGDDLIRVFVLFGGGVPAGCFELDGRVPDAVELVHVGLATSFRGRGLGRYLLAAAVETAWDEQPTRVWVRSTNLDDPRRVLLYQWAGFVPYDTERQTVDDGP